MTKFKWLFMLVYLAMLAALVLAYGWGAAILAAFGRQQIKCSKTLS